MQKNSDLKLKWQPCIRLQVEATLRYWISFTVGLPTLNSTPPLRVPRLDLTPSYSFYPEIYQLVCWGNFHLCTRICWINWQCLRWQELDAPVPQYPINPLKELVMKNRCTVCAYLLCTVMLPPCWGKQSKGGFGQIHYRRIKTQLRSTLVLSYVEKVRHAFR